MSNRYTCGFCKKVTDEAGHVARCELTSDLKSAIRYVEGYLESGKQRNDKNHWEGALERLEARLKEIEDDERRLCK